MFWFAFALWLGAQAPAQPSPEWTVLRKQWEEVIQLGQQVIVENPFGDVRVRGTDDKVSIVTVNQQVFKGQDDFFTVEVQHTEVAVIFVVKTKEPLHEKDRRRLDLSLFLPPGSALHVNTTSGLIEARGLSAEATCETISGEIQLKSKANVTAKSERGKIRVIFMKPSGTSLLRTNSGDIEVLLPREADMKLQLQTQGAITTDFSIHIDSDRNSPTKKGAILCGKGSSFLSMESLRGALIVKQIQ